MAELTAPALYISIGDHISKTGLSTDQQVGVPAYSSGVIVQAIGQNVRIRLDGQAATATTGFQLRAGDPPVLIPIKVNSIIHVIQEAATATLQIQAVAFA